MPIHPDTLPHSSTHAQHPLKHLCLRDPPTCACVAFIEGCSNCPPTHAANWSRLEQEVLTVQLSSTRLPPVFPPLLPLLPPLLLLRLKARGAGATRPESTPSLLGITALRSSRS